MKQLHCRDLRPGDLLLKASDGSFTSRMISFGQSLFGQPNSTFVHAGLMFDSTYIIEAQGGGLSAHDLRIQNKNLGYLAFRPISPNLGQGAGTCAKMLFDIHKTQGTLKYNFTGALGSLFGNQSRPRSAGEMDQLLDRVLSGRGSRFFCSQFVVYVYQFVAAQNGLPPSSLFATRDGNVSPSELGSMLRSSGYFAETGYLLPGER